MGLCNSQEHVGEACRGGGGGETEEDGQRGQGWQPVTDRPTGWMAELVGCSC